MADLDQLREKKIRLPEFCQSELWPLVDAFEADNVIDRSKVIEAFKQAAPLLIGGWLVTKLVPAPAHANSALMAQALMALAGLGMAAGVVIVLRPLFALVRQHIKRAQAERALKSDIKQRTIRFLDSEFRHFARTNFPEELYQTSGLFPSSYDRATAEDRCLGIVGETKFELIEIGTYEIQKSGSGKNQRTKIVPIFKGLLFKADFNKNFEGHTTVQLDGLEAHFGFLARAGQKLFSSLSSLQLVELENPEFEAVYKVRSTNATEARFLLTPLFMERILALRMKRDAKIQFAFRDSSVIVAVPHASDFMEFRGGLQNLTTSVTSMCDELLSILELIDDLDLNNRIWNKSSRGA